MGRLSTRSALLLLLGAGLALRLVLGFVMFPGQGLSGDIGLFHSWAADLAANGPSAFYASEARADYPVGYLYVLWALGGLATNIGPMLGIAPDRAILLALKLPAIAADMGIAWLLFLAARRWIGSRAGLAAAAVYLFVPVTWYDSALWGQVDAVGTLLMLAAILLLIDGWSEAALTVGALGVLVKPQAFIALVVIIPVLIRRHVLRIGSGPVPVLGRRLSRFNHRLGGLITDQGPVRLASAGLLAAVAVTLPLLPFDIDRFAPASLSTVPVLGKLAGLVGLFQSVSNEFSVLTANAYNLWALVSSTPLSSNIGVADGTWTADSITVFAGLPAVVVGAAMLAGVCLLVAAGLLLRDGRLHIVVAFTLLAFAFYALPTRVHERYLFPAFAAGALLAVRGATWAGTYLGIGALNAINLHAVLAAALRVGFGTFANGGTGAPGGRNPGGATGTGPGGGVAPAGAGIGGGAQGTGTAIQLPFADLARSEPVVIAVALGQTLAFVALLCLWVVLVVRPQAVAGFAAGRTRPELVSVRPAAT